LTQIALNRLGIMLKKPRKTVKKANF